MNIVERMMWFGDGFEVRKYRDVITQCRIRSFKLTSC